MGIYIKGMEMPQNCCACFCSREDECGITHYKPTFNEWYEDGVKDCPLIPVSDHGELIDRDALLTQIDAWEQSAIAGTNPDCPNGDAFEGATCISIMVEDAPTVIPADKEAHHEDTAKS